MKKAITGTLVTLALGIGTMAATPAMADPPHGQSSHGQSSHGQSHGDDRGPNRKPDKNSGYRDHDDRKGMDQRANRRTPPHMVHVYDYNRPDPRYRGYYADRYYRGGYAPMPVTRSMRIYRGDNGRYYCRRSDGTTGLIVGAAIGGLLGNQLDRGESGILGTLLGASAGALIGREIDRGDIVCR
ncbi:MAG: glycine zipper 2TM domain-containing protein [Sphingomonadales bacterium]|nr:MAG: glycine zipper 2TM domain-containing protein [Sphingomonadales bacterium]TNF02813.1 MAG: glycine zipper 2TM domain-containing protein [Sphingomonadales bacterium]